MTFTTFIPPGLVQLVCGPEAGGAWAVIRTGSQLASVTLGESFETARVHGNKLLYVRTDNTCHLSTASRKQTL
jgi:hypothetical protein